MKQRRRSLTLLLAVATLLHVSQSWAFRPQTNIAGAEICRLKEAIEVTPKMNVEGKVQGTPRTIAFAGKTYKATHQVLSPTDQVILIDEYGKQRPVEMNALELTSRLKVKVTRCDNPSHYFE